MLDQEPMSEAALPEAEPDLLSDDEAAWPILQCANVFVLPGVPALVSAVARAR